MLTQTKKKEKEITAYSYGDLSFSVEVLATLSREEITLDRSVFLDTKLVVVLIILVSTDPESPSGLAHAE